SSATIVNCTFGENEAPSDGTAVYVSQTSSVTFANCVLWDNTPRQLQTESGTTVTLSYSDIQGGWSGAGSGNIDQDPHFVDPAADNYHLSPFSLCIDAGDNSALSSDILTDLDGLPRFVDDPWMPNRSAPPVDMGAYEFQGSSCRADFDGDGFLTGI